jgi:hypothetical protein
MIQPQRQEPESLRPGPQQVDERRAGPELSANIEQFQRLQPRRGVHHHGQRARLNRGADQGDTGDDVGWPVLHGSAMTFDVSNSHEAVRVARWKTTYTSSSMGASWQLVEHQPSASHP